jgi:DNA-binding phage protein
MSHTLLHNATFGEDLSPAQQQALAALLAGRTVTAAATAAGVNRTTVYRWLRDPDRPGFRRALERGRRELRQAMEARLLALASKAADCLEGALTDGDGKAALALLKGLGFLSGLQQ